MNQPLFHVEPLPANIACPLCGSREARQVLEVKDYHYSNEVFLLSDCIGCGFRRTQPQPSPETIGRYYNAPDYFSHDASTGGTTAHLYRWVRTWSLGRKHKLIRRFQPGGRFLDMGCGTGEWLAFLSTRGYHVEGVEPGLRARERAIQQFSLKVVPQLEQVHAREQFQGASLWHVAEHLHDLQGSVKRLHSLLTPKGFLFIAVPARESWDMAHYGPYWAAWDVPRHLWHFRRQDMVRLLEVQGFKLIATRRMWFDAYYIALLSERYLGRPAWLAWALACIIGTWSNVVSAVSGRPTSSVLFIAQKA
ncbi:MAG: class I SAM-dependent methyltransferase [Flavobacteriales bacterium]|nr:class I SAM-dependent methyltransferase [Flavobacteriales bacterium]